MSLVDATETQPNKRALLAVPLDDVDRSRLLGLLESCFVNDFFSLIRPIYCPTGNVEHDIRGDHLILDCDNQQMKLALSKSIFFNITPRTNVISILCKYVCK